MDNAGLIALSLLIIFASTLTRSTLGFGDALIAMPLLTLTVGVYTATPLVGMVAPTIAITIVSQSWRSIDLHATWRLILATALGIPFGLLLLRTAPESLITGALGLFLILFGLYFITKPHMTELRRQAWVYFFGLVAGVLGSAYNANGPPVVVYGTLRRWSPERFRATLQGYFLPTGLLIMASHGVSGLWTAGVLKLYALSLPIVVGATLLGGWINKRIAVERFARLVHIALIVLGVMLLARALMTIQRG